MFRVGDIKSTLGRKVFGGISSVYQGDILSTFEDVQCIRGISRSMWGISRAAPENITIHVVNSVMQKFDCSKSCLLVFILNKFGETNLI